MLTQSLAWYVISEWHGVSTENMQYYYTNSHKMLTWNHLHAIISTFIESLEALHDHWCQEHKRIIINFVMFDVRFVHEFITSHYIGVIYYLCVVQYRKYVQGPSHGLSYMEVNIFILRDLFIFSILITMLLNHTKMYWRIQTTTKTTPTHNEWSFT